MAIKSIACSLPDAFAREYAVQRPAITAGVALEIKTEHDFGSFVQRRYDRYLRFLQLDRQNRNIFTSQEKCSFDTKTDALVLACRLWVWLLRISDTSP